MHICEYLPLATGLGLFSPWSANTPSTPPDFVALSSASVHSSFTAWFAWSNVVMLQYTLPSLQSSTTFPFMSRRNDGCPAASRAIMRP